MTSVPHESTPRVPLSLSLSCFISHTQPTAGGLGRVLKIYGVSFFFAAPPQNEKDEEVHAAARQLPVSFPLSPAEGGRSLAAKPLYLC